jgi:hypothetical protein
MREKVLEAARRLEQLFTPLSLGNARADFFNLQSDSPASAGGVFSHRTSLQGNCLLVVSGHTSVKTGTKHRFASCEWVAKNPRRFRFSEGPFFARFQVSLRCGRRGSFSASPNRHSSGKFGVTCTKRRRACALQFPQ